MQNMAVGDSADGDRNVQSEERRGIPENGLPIWETLPLWAKLPVPPAPKNAFLLTTTNLCEKIRSPSSDNRFDLTDPEVHEFSNEYQSLHDPHLKYHYGQPLMRYRLEKGGFITKDGKVLCTLREYNEYRKYLRAQEWQTQVIERRKQDEHQTSEINKRKQQYTGNGLNLNRAQKVKAVSKRLQQRFEQDKERYSRIVEEDEARRDKIRRSRLEQLNEQERKRKEDELKRRAVLTKKDEEERRKKLLVYAKWTKDDQMRRARMEERRRRKEFEQRRKLDKMWEERKRQQNMAIRTGHERSLRAEERRQQRVHEYTMYMDSLARRREDHLLKMQEEARIDRIKQQETYANKLQKTLRTQRSRKRAERMKSKRAESRLQSNWDWTQSLKRSLDKASSENDLQIKTGAEDIELERKYSASELGLFDLRGANFDEQVIDETPKHGQRTCSHERLSQLDLGDLRGANLKKRLYGRLHKDPKHQENVDKLLAYICTKYRGADMVRIKQAIVDNALEDKPSRTNVLGLEAEMFPEQGCVPEELATDGMGHVPILKQIASLQDEDFVGPKPSRSAASIDVSPTDSGESRGEQQTYMETLSEVYSKVSTGQYTDLEQVAKFLVGWTINLAATIVHPASRLGSVSDSSLSPSDQHPSFLASVMGRPGSSSTTTSIATSASLGSGASAGSLGSAVSEAVINVSPYKDTALHLSLLGIGERGHDQAPRFSLQNDTITLNAPTTSDHGPMSRINLRDSVTLTKTKKQEPKQIQPDEPVIEVPKKEPAYTGPGVTSLEDLIETLTTTLGEVRNGAMTTEQVEKLRVLATGILESAAVLADGVDNFVDEQERLLARRSSLLIEALISDTLDQVLEDVKQNQTPNKTSSDLIADLVSYTLNEALDDTRNINSDRLARIDSILVDKFITNNLHDALSACREGRPTAEAMLLQSFIQNVVTKAVVEIVQPDTEISTNARDMACTIVQSIESVQDREPTPRDTSVSGTALTYVTTILDHVLLTMRQGQVSDKETREMALKMGLVSDEKLDSDENLGQFVEALLVKCSDEIDAETADRVVTNILSDAAFLASEIGDGYLVKQLMAGLESGRNTALSAILMNDDDQSQRSVESTPDLLEGLPRPDSGRVRPGSSNINRFVRNVLSDVVIHNFIDSVLSGQTCDRSMGAYSDMPRQSPVLSGTSISETVVNTFVKKILNSALESLPPSSSESDSIVQFVSGIIAKSHSFCSGAPSKENIEVMADEITEGISALSVGRKSPSKTSNRTTDSCPAVVTPSVGVDKSEPVEKDAGLSASQQELVGARESLHEHKHLSDTDESSEEELPEGYVDIHPVYKGEEVHIDPAHAEAALGAISVKRLPLGSHLMHNEAVHRNSFSSLVRPDLSTLKNLQNKSVDQVKDKLEHAYEKSVMMIHKSVTILSDDEAEDDVSDSADSELEYVLKSEQLNDDKASSMPGIRVQAATPTEQRKGNSLPNIKRRSSESVKTSSKELTTKQSSKSSSLTKTTSKSSKETVPKTSESRKSATNSSSRLSDPSRRKSAEKKPSRTSSTGASISQSRCRSPYKPHRSSSSVSPKKSTSATRTQPTSASDVTENVTEPNVVKSIRSVDGTFSSKVEVRATTSTGEQASTSAQRLVSPTRGIIMENEDNDNED